MSVSLVYVTFSFQVQDCFALGRALGSERYQDSSEELAASAAALCSRGQQVLLDAAGVCAFFAANTVMVDATGHKGGDSALACRSQR